jgi:hypothetical protein
MKLQVGQARRGLSVTCRVSSGAPQRGQKT